MNEKTFTLDELFTAEELAEAAELYKKAEMGTFNKLVVPKIIEPAMARINHITGQKNDARYMGYVLEFCLMTGKSSLLVPDMGSTLKERH